MAYNKNKCKKGHCTLGSTITFSCGKCGRSLLDRQTTQELERSLAIKFNIQIENNNMKHLNLTPECIYAFTTKASAVNLKKQLKGRQKVSAKSLMEEVLEKTAKTLNK